VRRKRQPAVAVADGVRALIVEINAADVARFESFVDAIDDKHRCWHLYNELLDEYRRWSVLLDSGAPVPVAKHSVREAAGVTISPDELSVLDVLETLDGSASAVWDVLTDGSIRRLTEAEIVERFPRGNWSGVWKAGRHWSAPTASVGATR